MDNKAKDDIFAVSLDSHSMTDMIEFLMDEPDFWISANRWLEQSCQRQATPSPYEITAIRFSQLISLLTARPSNPECIEHYEMFANLCHDVLLHSARFMLNDMQAQKERIEATHILFPAIGLWANDADREAFENMAPMKESQKERWLESFSKQVESTNKWTLTEADKDKLKWLASQGQFPISIIDDTHLYTYPDTGRSVANFKNISNKPESLSFILSVLLDEAVARNLAVKALEPRLADQLDISGIESEHCLAIALKGSPFLDLFDYPWVVLADRAMERLYAATGIKQEEPVDSQPRVQKLSRYEISSSPSPL